MNFLVQQNFRFCSTWNFSPWHFWQLLSWKIFFFKTTRDCFDFVTSSLLIFYLCWTERPSCILDGVHKSDFKKFSHAGKISGKYKEVLGKLFGWSEPITGVLLQTFYQRQLWIGEPWQSGSDCGVSWSARIEFLFSVLLKNIT